MLATDKSIGGSYNFPRLDQKDKGEAYHTAFCRAILNHCIDDGYANNYRLFQECYKFLEEGSNGELTQHLQKAEDGTDLPAMWLSLNTLPTKVDLLTGELEARGYEIKVRALNKEAISRKLEEKERLRVERRLQEIMQTLEQQTGLQVTTDEYIPQTDKELDEYIDLTFKDKAEIIMESALKFLAKKNDWDEERRLLFRDVLITGRCFVRNEIVRGVPRARRISPLNMVIDPSCKTDTLEDATYFGELEYISIGQAAERFNLSDDEIKDVYTSYSQWAAASVGSAGSADDNYAFRTIANGRLKWFKEIEGQLRVLVTRAVWDDYKVMQHKHEINEKYGTEHLQEITDKVRNRDKSNIITNKMQVWRQCTIIGGKIIREWGECPNQARNLSELEIAEPPYKGWIPNFASGRGVSKVEQMASIQLSKDIAMYNMSVAMTRAGARGMTYDLAMVPAGWTPEQAMKYMRVFGVMFINSKESQMMPGNASTFREFDMTLSQSIAQYIEIMRFYDNEMDKISGVSPERQGVISGSSLSPTVQQSALTASNLITAPYFNGFRRFNERVLNQQAKLVKIVFPHSPEVFAPIIGSTGVDFLKEHIDLDLDEFGAFVEALPPMFIDRQKLESLLMMTVQSDPTFIDDALAIMMEQDTSVAVRKFQRRRGLRKALEEQQAQAAQQQEQELQMKMKALEQQQAQQQMQAQMQDTQMKNEGQNQRALISSRTKLNDSKIKGTFDLAKIQAQPKQPPKTNK